MASQERPMGLALLVCDSVIQDKHSNKRTLVGLFDRLFAAQLPCVHPMLSVFVSLTSARGEYACEVRCRPAESDEAIFEARGKVRFQDPLQVVELVFNFQGVRFSQAGDHWLECRVDEVPVMMRRLLIVQGRRAPKKDGH